MSGKSYANKCPKCKEYKRIYNDPKKKCLDITCRKDIKLNEQMIKKIESALKLGYTIEKMRAKVGISNVTWNRWNNIYPEFKAMVTAAKFYASDIARRSVIESMAKDGALALKWLERKEKDEFSTKTFVHAHNTSTGELSREENEAIQNILKEEGIEMAIPENLEYDSDEYEDDEFEE